MTTEQFYQIASMASAISELAKEGEEMCGAIHSEAENIERLNILGYRTTASDMAKAEYQYAKAKIEERIKAKNEELQKLIASSNLVMVKFTYKDKFGRTGTNNVEIAERDSELAIATFEKKHPDIVWRNFEFL